MFINKRVLSKVNKNNLLKMKSKKTSRKGKKERIIINNDYSHSDFTRYFSGKQTFIYLGKLLF